jgi:ribonuclease BN (tRNA processing enzyme)
VSRYGAAIAPAEEGGRLNGIYTTEASAANVWRSGELIRATVLFSKSAIGTQLLLIRGRHCILVDVGDGTLRDLVARRFDFDALDGILITHEHFDHTGGLFSLLHFMRHLPRRRALSVYLPGPATYLPKLLKAPLMYSKPPFKIRLNEAVGGKPFMVGGFHVVPFQADHVDAHTLGYSVADSSGFRVVVSGDTRSCPELKKQARGADVAFIESTFEDGQEGYAAAYGHMTRRQAEEVGRLARKAIFIHQMPQEYFTRMTCSDLSGDVK